MPLNIIMNPSAAKHIYAHFEDCEIDGVSKRLQITGKFFTYKRKTKNIPLQWLKRNHEILKNAGLPKDVINRFLLMTECTVLNIGVPGEEQKKHYLCIEDVDISDHAQS